MKASRSPRGETLRLPIHAGRGVSKTVLPIGNSSTQRKPSLRTTASSPAGDQSAATTSSATACGVPPPPGTRARGAEAGPGTKGKEVRETASSPVGEIAAGTGFWSPSGGGGG